MLLPNLRLWEESPPVSLLPLEEQLSEVLLLLLRCPLLPYLQRVMGFLVRKHCFEKGSDNILSFERRRIRDTVLFSYIG